jgi:hypothetical protein
MKIILSFLLVINSIILLAKIDTVMVEDLRFSWIAIEGEQPVPVVDPNAVQLLSFTLEPSAGQLLKISNDAPYDLWINMRLLESDISGPQTLSLDLLKASLNSDTLNIQIWSKSGVAKMSTTLWKESEVGDLPVELLQRKDTAYASYYVFGTFLIILFTAICRRYFGQRYVRIFNNPFNLRVSSMEDAYSDFFDSENILFVLYVSIIAAFEFNYFQLKADLLFAESLDWSALIFNWIKVAGVIFGFFIVKFIVGQIASLIFNFRSINNIHNQDFLNFFVWIFYVIWLLTLIDFSIGFLDVYIKDSLPRLFVGIMLIAFQIAIYLKLRKYIPQNKIMIISYLCATEFMPGFLMIYLLLK